MVRSLAPWAAAHWARVAKVFGCASSSLHKALRNRRSPRPAGGMGTPTGRQVACVSSCRTRWSAPLVHRRARGGWRRGPARRSARAAGRHREHRTCSQPAWNRLAMQVDRARLRGFHHHDGVQGARRNPHRTVLSLPRCLVRCLRGLRRAATCNSHWRSKAVGPIRADRASGSGCLEAGRADADAQGTLRRGGEGLGVVHRDGDGVLVWRMSAMGWDGCALGGNSL